MFHKDDYYFRGATFLPALDASTQEVQLFHLHVLNVVYMCSTIPSQVCMLTCHLIVIWMLTPSQCDMVADMPSQCQLIAEMPSHIKPMVFPNTSKINPIVAKGSQLKSQHWARQ